ncbi:MAG: ATP-dependent RNA helicase HrpA [Phycisphaerae bacterium]|nr:ATP-dependent RNA helicase HrpA [Phycisphaerae bacterium]
MRPAELFKRLDECTLLDAHRLGLRLRAMQRASRGGALDERALAPIAGAIERSAAVVARRRARLPTPTYPADLPVSQRRDDIARAIRDHQVVVVCGQTGSGKTTQLPKICLELGRGVRGSIGHTQPRRIAARSVADRIAHELSTRHGDVVGSKVRFGDRTSPETLVKLMTDGILLAETQGDRLLLQYDTLIIDEAHERSLNIDFLLGYLRQLLPRRPDLKVIVTSATIDPLRFSDHFGGAPVIEVSGRTYPVEVRYRPHEDEDEAVLRAVDELAHEPPGDVLVFLPGEREIREAAEALRKHHPPRTEILPLYARLSNAEQQRVFEAHSGRRIVLATNVAETSLTVPGIRYVVDTGEARISRYSPGTKVQRLPTEAISRASADQRAGRCGRVAPGICIRLYSEEDFRGRDEFTDPEIVRTNLASVILQMKSLNLGPVEAFPFIDPPDHRLVRDGYDTLLELGAIDEENHLTEVGRRLAKLPMDPRLGRVILSAAEEGCLAEVQPIAAFLASQDPRDRPIEKQDQADAAHAEFQDEASDFIAILNLWRAWRDRTKRLTSNKLRAWCRDRFLSYVRMREWDSTHEQVHGLISDMGFHPNAAPATPDAIHRALLAGLLSSIGKKADRDGSERGGERGGYQGPRGSRFWVFPGSGLFKKQPDWVVAAEMVQTTRLYARTVARVDPAWIERAGAHLLKRTFGEPVWHRESARVVAPERVTLFGLELAAGRMAEYATVDPALCRRLLIHHMLVEDEYDRDAAFRRHNRSILAQALTIEAKTRRPDALADSLRRFEFFDRRVPADITDGAQFERWRKDAERRSPRLLFMSLDDVLVKDVSAPAELFPERVPLGPTTGRVEYRFEPGKETDGVTVTVPLQALHELDTDRLERLVPGHLASQARAILEGLPKAVRRSLGPIEPLAERCASDARAQERPIAEAVLDAAERHANVTIPDAARRAAAVPEHLIPRLRVVDERGQELAAGRDARRIKAELEDRARASFARLARSPIDRDGIKDWDFGPLPRQIEIARGQTRLTAYPSLVERDGRLMVRALESPDAAAREHRKGLRRLFSMHARDEVEYQLRLQPEWSSMAAHHAALGPTESLKRALADLIVDAAFLADGDDIRSREAFESRLSTKWHSVQGVARQSCQLVAECLRTLHRVRLRLSESLPPAWGAAVADIRSQLDLLTPPGFLESTPTERLRHLPRYLAAILLRLQKLQQHGPERDARHMAELGPLWRAYLDTRRRVREAGQGSEALDAFQWRIEELRVSLFAQELGTAEPVSRQRLERAWSELRL